MLPSCRGVERRLVWEVGGGWGGFACQFKTVCPNVTYLITARPELLLASATYLQAAFPSARVRVHEGDAVATWAEWPRTDFVFATESSLPSLRPPAVDVVRRRAGDRGDDAGASRAACAVRAASSVPVSSTRCNVPAPARRVPRRRPRHSNAASGCTRCRRAPRTPAAGGRRCATATRRGRGLPHMSSAGGGCDLTATAATPRVVFGVPGYNRPDALARTLESLLAQTVRDLADRDRRRWPVCRRPRDRRVVRRARSAAHLRTEPRPSRAWWATGGGRSSAPARYIREPVLRVGERSRRVASPVARGAGAGARR